MAWRLARVYGLAGHDIHGLADHSRIQLGGSSMYMAWRVTRTWHPCSHNARTSTRPPPHLSARARTRPHQSNLCMMCRGLQNGAYVAWHRRASDKYPILAGTERADIPIPQPAAAQGSQAEGPRLGRRPAGYGATWLGVMGLHG